MQCKFITTRKRGYILSELIEQVPGLEMETVRELSVMSFLSLSLNDYNYPQGRQSRKIRWRDWNIKQRMNGELVKY
jgi:hypothetical protein